MQCNIDNRGVRFRRTMGIINVIVGVLIAALALWTALWWLWIPAALALVGGIFALYEARNKWCALRAMGIKTRI